MIKITSVSNDIFSLDYFASNYDISVYMNKHTNEMLSDRIGNLSYMGESLNLENTIINKEFNHVVDGQLLSLSGIDIKCYHYPGHSQRCMVYEFDNFILTGDFIFKDTIGRVDFPNSNPMQMRQSLLKFKKEFKKCAKRFIPST